MIPRAALLTLVLALQPLPGAAREPNTPEPPGRQAAAEAAAAPGLSQRISLAGDDDPLRYGRDPLPATPAPRSSAPDQTRRLDLAGRIDVELHEAANQAASVPGRRLGHGDLVLSLPLSSFLAVRTGVRVDYDQQPRDFDAEPTPTLGVAVRF